MAGEFMASGLLESERGAAEKSASERNGMSAPTRRRETLRLLLLWAVLALAAFLASRDILDEGSGMHIGDMPRYLMNGVFLYDLLASGGVWNVNDLIHHAELYYAQYPALSLGHHPPLLYVSLVPFFAVTGISVFSARLASVAFFLLATWAFYALTKRIAGHRPALWGTLLLVTNVFVVRFGQYTLSEVPMLALILVALNALVAYGDSRQPRHFAWFIIAASASLYAKQHAVFVFPLYAFILWSKIGWRDFFIRHILVWTAVGAVLSAPAIVMTVLLSPGNVGVVAWNLNTLASGEREQAATNLVLTIVNTHVSLPVALAALAGLVTLCVYRRGHAALGLLWLGCGIVGAVVATGPVESARYSFVAIPAYFFLAAGLSVPQWSSRSVRVAVTVVLAAVVGWQIWLVREIRPVGAGGYEDVARYVVEHSSTPVLYDSPIDTGFFVFFVRKHDPTGKVVVLRAEKLFGIADANGVPNVTAPEHIPPLLKKYGVKYIVVEDRTKVIDPARRRLLETLRGEEFSERQRVPIRSRLPWTQGIDLVVYEFADAGPPDLDAELHMGLPLAGRTLKVRLRDLSKSP